MDKITRYLILLFICIVFFALAPLIVIYVSGKGLNFSDSTNGTGILDVQTDPSSAQVYLNGKKSDTTPATMRFVKQGTYQIEIKKDGYRSWSKSLFIEAGKVTYAGSLDEAIILLPDSTPINFTDKIVSSALVINNQVLFSSADKTITLYDLSQKKVVNQSNALPEEIIKFKETQSNNFVITTSSSGKLSLLDVGNLKLIDLPTQFKDSSNINIISENIIVALKDNSIYSYNLKTKGTAKVILDDVRGFTLSDNIIYAAKSGTDSLQTYYWDGKTLTKQGVLFSGEILKGKSTQLFLTDHKELFLLVDSSLFRINSQPELLNNQVQLVNFNSTRQELTFTTPTEIYFYNFISSKTELFYRNSQTLTQAVVVPELGYGFVSTTKDVTAVEIDNRNGQNRYSLLENNTPSMMQLSGNENQLVVLAGQKLYSIIVN